VSLTVKQRADQLGTFRFFQVHLMETLARWVPTTPEMEIKVLFGRHIWDAAQQADALGKRTNELRAPLHYTVSPAPGILELLNGVRALVATPDRVRVFYDVLLPQLAAGYRQYLAETDALLDEPSCRVVSRILSDFDRMRAEREQTLADVPQAAAEASPSATPLFARAHEIATAAAVSAGRPA
jgi:hypothetical protein